MDQRLDSVIDLERLGAVDPDEYASASPFPHGVYRGLVDEDLLDAVAAEFPDPGRMGIQFDRPDEVKSAESRWDALGPASRRLVTELNSEPVVDQLERITGINGLIVDHHLTGGGQHQISRGGRLNVHADFSRHRQLHLDRRLNVLVYLNRDWDEDWGGHLELWDRQMTRPVVRVAPTFNTMVVFSTTSTSYHGHPDPLQCPPDRTRRSVATYYYTARHDPSADLHRHSTLFQRRPGESGPTREEQLAAWRADARKALRHFKAGAKLLVPVRR
jgi:hypothetical protein